MDRNIILQGLNELGAVYGYPFYMYEDGSVGQKIVSPDGNKNAKLWCKKPFIAAQEPPEQQPVSESSLIGDIPDGKKERLRLLIQAKYHDVMFDISDEDMADIITFFPQEEIAEIFLRTTFSLEPRGEKALIKRGDFILLMLYTHEHFLSEEAEEELLRCGNEKMAVCYMYGVTPSEKSLLALAERGNAYLISVMLNSSLSSAAILAVLEEKAEHNPLLKNLLLKAKK